MPPSRGICAACRLKGFQTPAPGAAAASFRRQFSGVSRISSVSQSSASHKLAGSPRSLLLSSLAFPSASRSLPVLQSRLQSTASPSTNLDSSSPSLDQQTDSLNAAYNYTPPETLEYVPPPAVVEAHLGWLHELGLDFGYGPSSCVQWLFEHVHVLSGFPFWGSIAATAVACRLMMVPLIMQSSETSSRLSAVTTITAPKLQELKAAASAQNQAKVQELRRELRDIYKSADIKMWKLALPMLQMPLGFALWRVTRNMADLPVPGLETGGVLWFTDLTHVDPFFILPFSVALLQHLSVKTGIEGMATGSTSPGMRKLMLFGLPAISVPIIGWAPAAVQLNFTATAACALFTNTIMRNPAIRARLGLSPIIRPGANGTAAAGQAASSYRGTMTVSGSSKATQAGGARRMSTSEATSGTATASSPPPPPQQQRQPWTQRLAPSSLVRAGRGLARSLGDQVEQMVPTAKAQRQTAAQKRGRRAADEYERRRAAEVARERAEFERGRRR